MADAQYEADAPPPVPGFWRLGWLLFMQPLTLRQLFATWGFKNDPSLWELRGRIRNGDPTVRALIERLSGWLLLVMPVSTVTVACSLALAGLPLNWRLIAFCIACGAATGILIGVTFGVASGAANGVVFGLSLSMIGELPQFVPVGISAAFSLGLITGFVSSFLPRIISGITRYALSISAAIGVVLGVIVGIIFGVGGISPSGFAGGVTVTATFSVTFFLIHSRLPLYLVESTLTVALRLIARFRPVPLSRLAVYLPYRHHELIYLPLPLLVGLLVRLGEEYPAEGRQALAEAATSLGQKKPASRALMELQARSLERAARERQYALAAAQSLPFLFSYESLRQNFAEVRNELERASELLEAAKSSRRQRLPSFFQIRKELTQIQELAQVINRVNTIQESFEPLRRSRYLVILDSIAAAAQDLEAARSTGIHHQRRQALGRARRELERALDRLTTTHRLTRDERRFVPVVKAWLDRVEDEEAALARLEHEQPQVPLVFVAGPALTPMGESLFVGRTDLVRLLDQDLAAERPVPLVLLGQRRMGKSTLLNFLPRMLGTGTLVVRLDFQGLSGNRLRSEPHRWVAEEVATALAGEKIIEASPASAEQAPWGAILDWLAALEEPLAVKDRRLLIALDEVEALERGIREKWSDPAFLDFLRAAGDRLRRIRFLLVTAHPFSRLGPHWSDRLISAQTRSIEPLREEEARMLLTQPVPGFPDIYPPGGVERLLLETACHPYLLQLTAYDLTRRLNDAGRLKATDDDLTAALDQALEENNLFQNLWDDLSATEQGLLAALARGEELTDTSETLSQARRDLAREQLIQRGDDGEGWRVAVPLFARWIREIGAAE